MTADERQDILTWTTGLAAEAAALATARIRAHGRVVECKADGTIVTDVDTAVERFVRERLEKRFPHDTILGEEYGLSADGGSGRLWAIDPVDGTNNLANGLPMWGISLGLIEDGAPAVGVLHLPVTGDVFTAAKGAGAWWNGRKLPMLPPGGAMTWDDTYSICSYSTRLLDFSGMAFRARIYGSAALDVCYTAAGVVRGAQSIGTKLWDVAAGMCLAFEVGAEARWFGGREWTADDMLRHAPREGDALIVAPPETMRFIRETMKWR